jgi:hypothetical protein
VFSNQYAFYNDLFFSVFNATNIKNKVRHKYKTKNNNTEGNSVFLRTINQIKARVNSRIIFKLTETRVCKVWLFGLFPSPLRKITNTMIVIREKSADRKIISVNGRISLPAILIIYPAPIIRIFNIINRKRYILSLLNNRSYLIKSFIAV